MAGIGRSYRKISLSVFLECTLGGFAKSNLPITDIRIDRRTQLRRLWDEGLLCEDIAERWGTSANVIRVYACRWHLPYRKPRDDIRRM